MSISEFSFSGGQDLTSEDVVADAQTPFLDDADGGSGIHTDFFSLLPGAVIDTHFTARGRLARLLGILAKASEDNQRRDILAIGIEEKTGVVIRKKIALVIGVGEVSLFQETTQSTKTRIATEPLRYTSVRMDRLTDGWRFDLTTKSPITSTLPANAEAVIPQQNTIEQAEPLLVSGALEAERTRFEQLASIFPEDYSLRRTAESLFVEGSIGFMDAGFSANRMDKQETLFRALYEHPGRFGFLLFFGGAIERTEQNLLSFVPSGVGDEMSTLVFDSREVTHRGLSPYFSSWRSPSGTLRAASLLNVRVHLLSSSDLGERRLDLRDGSLVR
jgi:hypothetical protein